MTHGERAEALFREGYNCAQAVFCAWADELRLDKQTAARLVWPLGGGMGRLREVCGTVSGALMVIGQFYGYGTPDKGKAKARLYFLEQTYAKRFAAANGSYICRDLLGLSSGPSAPTPDARTAEYYQKRPCPQLCKVAADLLEEMLAEIERGDL